MIALHALMGGLAAKAQGGEFATGALAAGANKALVSNLHGQLEGMDQKDQESLLLATSQLVGLLAAAVQGSDGDGSQLSIGAGIAKDATQYNNFLHDFIPQGLTEYGSAATSLATHMTENGAAPDELSQALYEYSMGDLPESADIISAYGTAYAYLLGGGAVVATAPVTSAGWLMLGGAIGGVANVGTSWALGNKIDPMSSDFWVDTGVAFGVGAMTQGRSMIGTIGVSVYGATVGSYLKAENPLPAQAGSLAGATPGYYIWGAVTKYGSAYLGSASGLAGSVIGAASEYVSQKMTKGFEVIHEK